MYYFSNFSFYYVFLEIFPFFCEILYIQKSKYLIFKSNKPIIDHIIKHQFHLILWYHKQDLMF